MIRVLCVCLGNICRSPAAEGVLRARAKARGIALRVDSAGTGGWHVGSPPDTRMQLAALRRGYDLSGLSAREVTEEDFRTFDHILAMDAQNAEDLKRLAADGAKAQVSLILSHAPDAGTDEVPDPYHGGPDDFEAALDLIELAADGFLSRLEKDSAA